MLKRIPIIWKLNITFFAILLLSLAVSYFFNFFAGVGIALVLGAVLIRLTVHRSINRPVQELVSGMNRLAEKEFDFRLEEDDNEEFGSLAVSFNDMASMLTSSLTELKKNQDYLRSILESSADIIITVNSSGRIQTLNTGAENALGYRRIDVVGQSIDILLADPHDRKVAAEKLRYSENVVNYGIQFKTKGGTVRDVLLTLSRLRNSAGAIIGTIVIGKDITVEKRLQKQLIQSQRFAAIGEVFTGIQHSMKNMLNACKGGAYMVRTGLAKDNRTMLVEGWDMVQEGIERMTNMSSDMLKYVKEWKPTCNRVDVRQILADICHVIKQTAKDKGVEFRLDVPQGLPPAVCDGKMIHSAVMDIASNALDACLWKEYHAGETAEVVLSAHASPDGQELVILVKDNGCGMTDEVKQNIFTPFFSTKSKAGTGLGLSIASRMIDVHGGKITVESEPNKGTIFQIVIPVDPTSRNKERADGEKGSGS
jgi:PAS domain S-box-containing protein